MWLTQNYFFVISIILFFSVLQVNCHANGASLFCSSRANDSESCDGLNDIEHQTLLNAILDDIPHKLHKKLLSGTLTGFTTEEIVTLPIHLLYFLPINKLEVLSGAQLATLLITHEDDTSIAKKILQSILTDQQRNEFLNCLIPKVIKNYKTLDIIGETVYKWNYDVRDGKFQKLSNVCGYTLARLWWPYVLTRTKPISTRLLTLLAEVEQKQNHRILCNKYTQDYWRNLPKSIRRLWSYLAVNQSYPSKLSKWTVEQIDQYKFLLPDFNNNELSLIPFDELSKMALHDIEFDNSQARFLFSLLLNSSTLKDVKILYPTFFYKLSPLQMNQFESEEWTNEKAAIFSMNNTYLSYAAAKQIFNKIASDWLSSKKNVVVGWTSDDLRHLPLFYTQPATSFLKFCSTPPSVQSLIAVDSFMLTDRQAFYLSGCSSMLSFQKNDPNFLLGLKYIIKAMPVSSLLNIDTGNISYEVSSHLVSLVNDNNLPMAIHLINITNPVLSVNLIEEMLKNKHNILFEQLAPMDIPGPIFDVLKQLYPKYTDRIDKLPRQILNVILESNELLVKWTGNISIANRGLFNGYTCNFIKKLSSANFIVSISQYNAYLKRNGKAFPKNLQICVAEAFIKYLRLKAKLTAHVTTSLYLEEWEIEAIPGFVLITLPVDVILNSKLRDNILHAIGKLSIPELMIASPPRKLSLIVEKYIVHIHKNESSLSYKQLYTLGNLTHFIPMTYLSLVEGQAFKLMIEAGLFDTRLCVDLASKEKWADLIIKSFGNLEHWSSDTLITLSDLLIVFDNDQLNSVPKMSRLDSADIIQTRYADEIEWMSNDIPFYKGCVLILGDHHYENFIDSLSNLINFHLLSIQNQLQMISPINDNHQHEEIIKSSEAKTKIVKPTVLIPIPELDNVGKLSTTNNLLKTFFPGKEKKNKTENIQAASLLNVIAEQPELIEYNLTSPSLEIRNGINDNIQSYKYATNKSFSLGTTEISTIIVEQKISKENIIDRKKRSFEIFFNSDVQIGCEALKILGPSSVASMQFSIIIRSMSDEELEDCLDLLGSFNINTELARYIWSKTKDKAAIHTYGSVLSGLSIDDIKMINLDLTSPWSFELINLLSKYVKTNDIRKEIIKQFMTKSKANIPSHLWGIFGSLLCQLQPRSFKIIMPNKELFWKTSSAFNTIKSCDMPCIKNLASIAVSVIGQSSSWNTAEVERLGIILSGINITQWQLLLELNPETLEGLSPSTIKCLNKEQIKLLNDSHMKHLTPKSAQTLLDNHSKLIDIQSKETLLKLLNFEINVDGETTSESDLQFLPATVIPKIIEGHKYLGYNNTQAASIYAFERSNHISSHEMQADSSEMQADSKAPAIQMFSFLILSAVLSFVLK